MEVSVKDVVGEAAMEMVGYPMYVFTVMEALLIVSRDLLDVVQVEVLVGGVFVLKAHAETLSLRCTTTNLDLR